MSTFLILQVLPGEGQEGEGEALSVGLGKGRVGDAAPGRSRGGCRMEDVDQGCVSD